MTAYIKSCKAGQPGIVEDQEHGEICFHLSACNFVPEPLEKVKIEELISGPGGSTMVGRLTSLERPREQSGDWSRELYRRALEHGDRAEAWISVLDHCYLSEGKSKPTQKWLKQAAAILEQLGSDAFAQWFIEAASSAPLQAIDGRWGKEPGLSDPEHDLLKGMVWMCRGMAHDLAGSIAALAERSYRKIPGYGSASTKVGNACVTSLSSLPDGAGVAHLSRLLGGVRYPSARRIIERALDAAAEASGQSRADIEEMAIPRFGLDESGIAREMFGDISSELVIENQDVLLRWRKADGKVQKSVPKVVREDFAEALKALKRSHKELKTLVAGQSARLERLWLDDRRLPLADFIIRYMEHPVVSQSARKLLWLVEDESSSYIVQWRNGKLRGLGGIDLELSDDATVRLLHLLDIDDSDELLVWRDDLEEQGITQPFAQLWREIYRAEPADSYTSNRFSGHIIRQHPLSSLCQRRDWRYGIQGYWDGQNYPTRTFEAEDVTATFVVEALQHKDDNDYIFKYLSTGELGFNRPIGDIPPLIFSELMRDVDLFVARCTVANDPEFRADEVAPVYLDYCNLVTWGPLRGMDETRAKALERALARTRLSDQVRIEGPDLVIVGANETYCIHIGSSQVRRSGATTALAIPLSKAAKADAAKVFLPYEGDSLLTEILAKAFYLADGGEVSAS